MIRAIIFDCIGVLYVDVTHAYFAKFPMHRKELSDLDKQSDLGLIDYTEYITAVSSITGVSREETAREFAKEHVINQPLIDIIYTFKPHYKIALLSNIGRGWIEDFFNAYQLHELFDVVILSSEEGMTKPDPLIFERTAERLGILPEECLMVDDSIANCEGARAAGMEALLYSERMMPTEIQRWIERPRETNA